MDVRLELAEVRTRVTRNVAKHSCSIDVAAMINVYHGHDSTFVINSVNDPAGTAPR